MYRIHVQKPEFFTDLKDGDSVCVNGVCLTVVDYNADLDYIAFDIGPETMKITGWDESSLLDKKVNLERSMKYGDRIHGHFLSGHVDETGTVIESFPHGETWNLKVALSDLSKPYVWKKGSIGLSGVSLTVNEVQGTTISVCLIPETLKLTNLSEFKPGQKINIEYDWMAKAFYQQIKNIPLQEQMS